jgi:hypothetical protein
MVAREHEEIRLTVAVVEVQRGEHRLLTRLLAALHDPLLHDYPRGRGEARCGYALRVDEARAPRLLDLPRGRWSPCVSFLTTAARGEVGEGRLEVREIANRR